MMNDKELAKRIKTLYAIVHELEQEYPGRKFTLDGHLIGSIGEVIAEANYDIKLWEPSHERHDGETKDGRQVQIKITQRNRVALSAEPDYLLVLKVDEKGECTEVYNGEGGRVWSECTKGHKEPKNGQWPISLAKLTELSKQVRDDEKVPKRRAE